MYASRDVLCDLTFFGVVCVCVCVRVRVCVCDCKFILMNTFINVHMYEVCMRAPKCSGISCDNCMTLGPQIA